MEIACQFFRPVIAKPMSDVSAYFVEWFVTREVRANVTVRFRDGKLLDVEPGRTSDAVELGSAALISGLVNAHTHLEFSGLDSPIPTTGRFTDWIRAVIACRHKRTSLAGDVLRSGIQESLESGTTVLGEIASSGWSTQDYSETDFRGVVFQEILGLSSDRIDQQKTLARAHSSRNPQFFGNGISPHAPYSTHLDLVRDAVTIAQQTGCPLAMHLAETQAEIELLANGTGEFREMLVELGLWRDDLFFPGQRPLDYLKLLSQAPRSLVVHGNYLDDEELAFLAANPQMTLVYCPRTHVAFGHTNHPWRRAKQLGARVALGTDSRASNPDLSLFAELQFVAAHNPDISHVALLQLGSSDGHSALGLEESNHANFTLVQMAGSLAPHPERDLFAASSRVCGTMIDGAWTWRDSSLFFGSS